jgi:hypothetical protein
LSQALYADVLVVVGNGDSFARPGYPGLGGGIIVTQTTSGANRFAHCALRTARSTHAPLQAIEKP